jgi:hypothetical protein
VIFTFAGVKALVALLHERQNVVWSQLFRAAPWSGHQRRQVAKLRHRRFFSLAEINAAIRELVTHPRDAASWNQLS